MTTELASPRSAWSASGIATTAPVDMALLCASRRELFTRQEAAQLLHDVQATVRDASRSGAVASIVNDALLSYGECQLVDGRRVVDPLLDIRLVVTR